MKKIAMSAGVALALLSPTAAWAASATIHLSAFVPVYCNVDLLPATGASSGDGLIALGTSREFCNSPHGYRIILQHPAHLVDAAIISDAHRIPLSQTGETVVWNSDQPGLEMRPLALDVGENPAAITQLSLRIEVKY
jgi:hypothetical protein